MQEKHRIQIRVKQAVGHVSGNEAQLFCDRLRSTDRSWSHASGLSRIGPPQLSRNDPGILKLRFESGGVRDEDDESSRCQRPGRDRAPVAAVGSGPGREWEGGNQPCSKPECQTARRKQENWRTRNPGYPVGWRIDQRATKDQIRPYRIPQRFSAHFPHFNTRTGPTSSATRFHQLDRRWEQLRVREPYRQRHLLAPLAENGQQTPSGRSSGRSIKTTMNATW